MPAPQAEPSGRADARRNRELILAAARDAVAEHGTETSLRDVARRAGVGIGTLYRHFATRDALLEALTRERFDRLRDRASALAAEPPLPAVLTWLHELALGSTSIHGLPDSVLTALADPESALHASCDAMRSAGAELLARAQAAGVVRTDVTPNDLLALTAGIAWASQYATDGPTTVEHLLTVVGAGLAP